MKKVKFGKIARLRKEKFDPQKSSQAIPCIELEHIEQGLGQINGWTNSTSQKSIKNIFHKGDILFSKLRPYLRKFWLADFEGVCSSEIWVLRPKNDTISKEYLFYFVQSNLFIAQANVSSGSKMPRADWNYIVNCSFLIVNSLPEQHAIAACLSTWDKAIDKTQKLIEQIKQRNKGLMQQLLTGKIRLRSASGERFCGEWKERKLGEFFNERKETGFEKLPLLSIGQNGAYPQSDSDKKDTSNSNKSKYKRICPNDIGYNTMRMWQGRSALSDIEGIVSPAYTIVSPKGNTNPVYFSYLFKMPKVVNLFWRNSQGLVSDTLNCKFKDFKRVKYKFPEKNEQTAISTVLDKATQEVQLQEEKLAAIKEQKKGLMQVLLTGKLRLNY